MIWLSLVAPLSHARLGFRHVVASLVVLASALASAAPGDSTSPAVPPGTAVAHSPAKAASQPATLTSTKPDWRDLSASQRAALAPLAAQWPGITEGQKRKWLALSQNFSSLTAAEQATMHTRMTEWVSLSAQQRSQARLNFAVAREVPANERMAQWEAYQALSPDQRQKLAASAPAKPMGAAPAVKPVAPNKLTITPATTQPAPGTPTAAGRVTPRIATGAHQINRQTLQPKAAPFAIPAPPPEIEHEATPSQ